VTVYEASAWMVDRFHEKRFLYQKEAASHLLHLNDEQLAYYDSGNNVCIGKKVLIGFNQLTPDAVYERAGKFWRDRLPSDLPGRQQ
jgi:hypothetical protein